MATITLSLISHTNVGKTTLARTMLRQDVGEVLDQAHVTDTSERHTLLAAPPHTLELWDTPGFGDTARLMRRLKQESQPLGWFLHQVWDRVVDRPLWCSQEAARNVKEHADIVFYLINAAEDPQSAAYVGLELELLTWIDRPVVVLLNQLGADGAEPLARWRRYLASSPVVRDVLSLDAFTRCWVEEGVLLRRVAPLLDGEDRQAMEQLAHAWHRRNLATFGDSCAAMARYLADTAVDREAPVAGGEEGRPEARDTFTALKDAFRFSAVDKKRAMASLNQRLDAATRELMAILIRLHDLDGDSAARIERSLQDFQVTGAGLPLNERSGALAGAVISGALSGLAADALTGGLSLGGGMIAGGILGALGGAALGRGYRLLGGKVQPAVTWAPQFLDQLVRQTLLRYLAVAHFGRGRGEYRDLERPDHWSEAVDRALDRHSGELAEIWRTVEDPAEGEAVAARLQAVLDTAVRGVLCEAYPDAEELLR